MDDATLKEFEKQYRDLPDARVEAEIERYLPDTAPRRVLLRILAERRSAAKEAERQRFRETYEQMERHHRDYKTCVINRCRYFGSRCLGGMGICVVFERSNPHHSRYT